MKPDLATQHCVTCGSQLVGKFCHKCGEKKLSRQDFTVKKFLEQIVDVFTHFDSKVIRSVILLFTLPGKLTSNYLDGKRTIYSKPIQLFFLINILYFLVLNYIGFDIVTNPLPDYMNNFLYGGFLTALINSKLAEHNLSLDEYANTFYNSIYVHSKLLIILMIPMFAGCLRLIYMKKDKLFYEHLVFSTYFFCFALLFYTIVINIVYYSLFYFVIYNNNFRTIIELNDEMVLVFVVIIFSIYIYLSLKRVHKHSTKEAVVYTMLAMVALSAVVLVYDIFIFFVVYFTN